MTWREIAALLDAKRRREALEDWQTARIVAIVEAVNSKHRNMDVAKWMHPAHRDLDGERERPAAPPPQPLTLAQIVQKMRAGGVPIIDKRQADRGVPVQAAVLSKR